jgi:hypothetical protein
MTSPETFRALLAANAMPPRMDLQQRTKNLCGKLNESLYKLAQEPSLAGYRVQEHVYKTVPVLSKEVPLITETTNQLNGVMFDLDYTSNFLDKLDDSIQNSIAAREIISELASKISAASSRAMR